MKLIREINELPLTETSNFNRMFIRSDRKDFVRVASIRKNTKARRVFFVKLEEEDLNMLIDCLDGTPISESDKTHNEFAIYYYQIQTL